MVLSKSRSLLLAVTFLATVSLVPAKELTVWFTPWAANGPLKPVGLAWVKDKLPSYLPKDVTIGSDYGPPIYQDGQQKFLVQGRRGSPDVIESVLEGLISYVRAGLIEPVDEQFDKWPDKSQFFDSVIKALTINGKLYGVPYNTNVRVLLYRKDLFQKYNLSVPKTWEELLKDASTISEKESGVAGLGLCTKQGSVRAFQEFISFFFQVNNGENPFAYDEAAKKWKVSTTPEKLTEVLQLYHNAFQGGASAPCNVNTRGNDYQALDNDYVNGKTAMVPMGPWIYQNRTQGDVPKKVLEEETGVAPLPLPPGGKQATYLEVKPISINAFSKNKAEAWEVVKALTSKEYVTLNSVTEGVNPTRKDVADSPEFQNNWWQKAFVEQLPTGVALAAVNWGLVITDITDAIQDVIYDKATPEDAGKALFQKMQDHANNNQL
ncbi:MAG: sugar ABC transporter substrate-binding protein [Verrucomicrobia bacterium]|nr:sugar ABC transporter substrate-binding protein [Verrucomicrobiota bacterium]